jgi:hypothetical protein
MIKSIHPQESIVSKWVHSLHKMGSGGASRTLQDRELRDVYTHRMASTIACFRGPAIGLFIRDLVRVFIHFLAKL